MKELLKYLNPYKKWVVLAPLLMLVEVGSELMIPKLMTDIINIGVANNDFGYIAKVGFLMILIAAMGIVGGVGCLNFAVRASQHFGTDIRGDLFKKIQEFSFSNIDKFKTSSLITRLTNDITQIQMVAQMSLRMLIRAPLLSVGGIIMSYSINKKLTLIFVAAVPVIVIVIAIIIKNGFPMFRIVQDKLDRVNTVMRENLSGVRVVKAFVREDYEKEKFDTANEDYRQTTLKAFNIVILLMPAMTLIMSLVTISIVWFSGIQVSQGTMLVGDITAFIAYSSQILMALMMIAMVFMFVSRSKVSADRISEVLKTEVDIKDADNITENAITKGRVEYKNVTFKYAEGIGDPVLEDVSFIAEPGGTVAILGVTGSGKSTLVNLMPRLYEVAGGEILVDGTNIKNIALEELRSKISVVLQETILFSGTIKENIKWGKEDALDEEVIEAAKAACAHDFIMELPDKYETELGQRGVNLSGGQKQRVSIARALLKSPKVLIFDDSTSAVDMVTEKKIQSALKENRYDCTKFIIAQRISSVKDADKILLLNDGTITASGNHEGLMETSPEYREIYYSQIKEGGAIHE